ncbi:MAG: hypothetical protein ACQCN5_12190 [Candidatus Bathyarchaeia archaeon]|jgi:uncharacterized C2H2 Zn-finger protein
MSSAENNQPYLKCPHCACIFFTQADLDAHLKRFGNNTAQHVEDYKKTHGRVEHGYGGEE